MRMIALTGRLCAFVALLAALLTVAPVASSRAQDPDRSQCSDGVDNDADNAVDGADAGCADGADTDETDSIYSGIVFVTVPLPVLTLQGTVAASGVVSVAKLIVRAQSGSTVDIKCAGKTCPFKKLRRVMLTNRLRLSKLERKLKPVSYTHLTLPTNREV